jgi:hypothetical protein
MFYSYEGGPFAPRSEDGPYYLNVEVSDQGIITSIKMCNQFGEDIPRKRYNIGGWVGSRVPAHRDGWQLIQLGDPALIMDVGL